MMSISVLLFAGIAAARTCSNLAIPVQISSRQGRFKKIPLDSNLDITKFVQEYTRFGQNYSDVLLEDYQTLNGQYTISAQFCHPDGDVKTSVIQLLIHGIGADKNYWDLPFNNYNYSYVDTAVGQGYATLAIDRLGIGNSSHGDPLNEIQAQAEIEALNAITLKLRHGQIKGINHRFEKVVHVGHSFGSIQSYWFSALYPNNTDGVVLTAWSGRGDWFYTVVAAWNLHSARLNQPLRFGNSSNHKVRKALKQYASRSSLIAGIQALLHEVDVSLSKQEIWDEIATTELGNLITGYNDTVEALNYPSGYITNADFTGTQFVSLLPGFFDPELGLLSEATKHPLTVGELLTIGSTPPSSSFNGPVLVVTGQQDYPFCGGNCYATGTDAVSIPAEAAAAFPQPRPFEAYIQPNAGHALNLHYNATGGYEVIQGWLKAHGLGA